MIEMGGEKDIPLQIHELLDDIHTLSHQVRGLEDVLDVGDLREYEIPSDELPNFRSEIDALATRVDVLANDVLEDVNDLRRRVSALDGQAGG